MRIRSGIGELTAVLWAIAPEIKQALLFFQDQDSIFRIDVDAEMAQEVESKQA
jgi:hypothetical protein